MDEILLVRVLTRLVRVHAEFGEELFKDAVHDALVAIARAVHHQALDELGHGIDACKVVRFPRHRKGREDDWDR